MINILIMFFSFVNFSYLHASFDKVAYKTTILEDSTEKVSEYRDLFSKDSYDEYIIPRIIHQIWVGKNTIHPQCIKAMQTLKDNHPKWQYKLWTDEDIDSFPWVNRDLFDKTENPGAKSDIWRYEIINLYGGVYLDVDFISLKPLDEIHKKYKFYSCIIDPKTKNKPCLANGIFGSVSGHSILKDLVEGMQEIEFIDSSDANSIMNVIGPVYFTEKVYRFLTAEKNALLKSPIMIFRPMYFFPIPGKLWQDLEKIDFNISQYDIDYFQSRGYYTIHLFTRSWVPSKQTP